MGSEPDGDRQPDDAQRRAAQDGAGELARMGIDPRALGLEPLVPPRPPAPPDSPAPTGPHRPPAPVRGWPRFPAPEASHRHRTCRPTATTGRRPHHPASRPQ